MLKEILLQKSSKVYDSKLFKSFGKVLLQDSTTLSLPAVLKNSFVGSTSQNGTSAVAKIQSIIDIKRMNFVQFILGSYTENDQKASKSILANCQKGDIVIRDLGYFSIPVFEEIMQAGVHFLSRLKFAVKIFDENGVEILLKELFKGNKAIDMWVYIGIKNKLRVRLVMVPLPKEQAAEKIRKAKLNKDKRSNHNEDYYKWQGYTIYITSVDSSIWTTKEVCNAYKVRWQIEIIFKSWKTGLNLQSSIHSGFTNEERVRVYIFLMLVFVCLFTKNIYCVYKDRLENKMGLQISIVKLSLYLSVNLFKLFEMTNTKIELEIMKHCCYEKRKDRQNITQLYKNENP